MYFSPESDGGWPSLTNPVRDGEGGEGLGYDGGLPGDGDARHVQEDRR